VTAVGISSSEPRLSTDEVRALVEPFVRAAFQDLLAEAVRHIDQHIDDRMNAIERRLASMGVQR
jgi:hypothetical protein